MKQDIFINTFDINLPIRERNVFLYWTGKQEFKLIRILRHLIYLHAKNGIGYTPHLITLENVASYIPNLHPAFFKLSPVQQADFVRINVIHDFGGIWLDADTIVLESLDVLFDIIDDYDSFFILQNNQSFCNGIFGSKKHTPIMTEWYNHIWSTINLRQHKIGPLSFGGWILDRAKSDKGYVFKGLDTMYPVHWTKCINEFLEKPYDNYQTLIRNFQPLVILVNSVYRYIERYSIDKIFYGYMPISYFINLSFKNLYMNNLHDYDFLEIGTANFDTLIQSCSDTARGISIEPVSYLYQQLPTKINVTKLNIAITQTEGISRIYYIPLSTIKKYNLPHFLIGCNSIDKYHPLHIKHKVQHLCHTENIICTTIHQLMYNYQIKKIQFLKIDTEGHDCNILIDLYQYIQYLPKDFYPDKIQFESNTNTPKSLIDHTIKIFTSIGYNIICRSDNDTLLQLATDRRINL